MSIAGKMSVGAFLIESVPASAMNIASTTNVYGRRSAVRTSHIGTKTIRPKLVNEDCATERRLARFRYVHTVKSKKPRDRKKLYAICTVSLQQDVSSATR